METSESEASKAEPFFKINFAQLITIASVVLGILWGVFGYGRDISDNAKRIEAISTNLSQQLTKWSADLASANEAQTKRSDKLEDYITKIDREGTQYGKGQLSNRTSEQADTVRRVEKLEDSLNKLVPTVTQMATNLEWISGWVKVQSQQPVDHKNK